MQVADSRIELDVTFNRGRKRRYANESRDYYLCYRRSAPNWVEGDCGVIGDLANKPGMVKIITRTSGHFDVHDAWFELISKGMTHILC